MNKKVKIGILGCANIAQRYAIKAFQALEDCEVVSVASRSLEKAKGWAEKFGIKTAESYSSLVKNNDIDALYIPLPMGLHKEWILKAAKEGKHVISEKSLAPDLASVKEIIETCKKNKIVLYENFTCDYHPQHHKVVELLKSGAVGKPHVFQSFYGFPIISADNFRYNRNLGGSALNESGAYQVYTARKLFGKEPISVAANLFIDPKNEIDMNGSVLMDLGDNLFAQFSFNLDSVYQNNYSIWGKEGLIKVGRAYAIPPDMKPIIEIIKNENRQEKVTPIDIPMSNHFESIFSDFCNTVLNKEGKKEKIKSIYSSILNQAKVLEAIRISAKEKRIVMLSEIR